MIVARHKHKRSSSQWVPPSAPLHNPITLLRSRSSREKGSRMIQPNHLFDEPRYDLTNFRQFTDNAITTTKYSLFTFIPYNIFHQMTSKYANIYFLFIAVMNFCPVFGSYTKFLGLVPIGFVLCTTLIKDGYEDIRRWQYDNKINSKSSHVWDRDRHMFRKMQWKHILVGDFVHVSNEQEIPADLLFLRSSDENGVCFVETSNLDGETSLKQRMVPRQYADLSKPGNDFTPPQFSGTVFCEPPDPAIYTIRAKIEYKTGSFEIITKDNMLLRGSRLRNTTFVEGIVLYAGHDTKVMMNNGRAPHKISGIEQLTNRFIILCIAILVGMVFGSSVMSAVWATNHPSASTENKYSEIPYVAWNSPKPFIYGLYNIGTFIICYQVIVPISLFITVEIIKGLQIFFISQDADLYDRGSDRSIECRSLNIPEELGQVTHVLSDKTGTLTENVMIFRNCSFDEHDYGPSKKQIETCGTSAVPSPELQNRTKLEWKSHTTLKHLFLNMVLNNSVVVNKTPHQDLLEVGFFENGVYTTGNSCFYDITQEQFDEMIAQTKRPELLGDNVTLDNEDYDVEGSTRGAVRTPTTPVTPVSPLSNMDLQLPSEPVSRVSSFSKFVKRNIISPITTLIPYDSAKVRWETPTSKEFCPYEAESPDELAIIEGAMLYGFKLEDKSVTHTTISFPDASKKKFSILQVLPFHSDRKRMSVVLNTTAGILMYCKGADSAIFPRLTSAEQNSSKCASLKERLNSYSSQGLRTLAFAMRLINKEEWKRFKESYDFVS
ncbi:hypothetical protein Q1695_012339 [Nippostrongylus brasiliensis]|nr:hypothetical protein Q1695_012339 [Nippostrongylus brasiliensis]